MLRVRTAAEKQSASFSRRRANTRTLAFAPVPMVVVNKANTRSTVHRPGYTDYVGVKRYAPNGDVVGEHRFLGLFTSTAYNARVAETPLLRGRVHDIAERAGLPPGGHLSKALDHILETYPRNELFQISTRSCTRPRSASSRSASASACACSCGAIRSIDSSPASSTCRARRPTAPTCA